MKKNYTFDFDNALLCAMSCEWYMYEYYACKLVREFNLLEAGTKEKCRPMMERFRSWTLENYGEEYEKYLTSMSIK